MIISSVDIQLSSLALVCATIKDTTAVRLHATRNIGYYWAEAFRDPRVERQSVPVRYDPEDVGLAYAFVQGRWVRCLSEQYAVLAGRSEREVALASAELRARASQQERHRAVSARSLGAFLVSLEAEAQLLSQRLRDLAQREVGAGRGEATPPSGADAAQSAPSAAEPSPPQPLQPYEVDP